MPFITIIITTHNRCSDLQRLALRSLEQVDYPDYEVLVVDDASSDGTEAAMSELAESSPRIRYHRNTVHRSLCHVRNLGWQHANGDLVIYIDDDCEVDAEWLGEIVRPFVEDDDVMVATGAVSVPGRDRIDTEIGCNMAFRASVFSRFSFDENLVYSHWYDERDLFHRIDKCGLKRVFTAAARVTHHVRESPFRKNHLGRALNCTYCYAKWTSCFRYFVFLLCFSLLPLPWTRDIHWTERHFRRLSLYHVFRTLRSRGHRGFALAKELLQTYFHVLCVIPFRVIQRRRQERHQLAQPTACLNQDKNRLSAEVIGAS